MRDLINYTYVFTAVYIVTVLITFNYGVLK